MSSWILPVSCITKGSICRVSAPWIRSSENARAHNQVTFLLQVLFFEKTIEALHITRSMQDRADQLAAEVNDVNDRLQQISVLSNLLAVELYSWYIRNGGKSRNEKDEEAVQEFS